MNWKSMTSRAARLLAGGAFVGLGLVVAGCAVGQMAPEAKAEPKPGASASADISQPATSVRPPRQDVAALRSSFADVLEPALESVVSIESITKPKEPRGRQPQLPFPFPFQMPDGDGPGDEGGESYGSGIVVRKDGVILTNNHVVEGASEVRVRFHDNRDVRAKVLGTDPATDLAVIKVDAGDLVPLPLGTSSDLRVGDIVFAIGSPFTLAQSVTMGIVSATGRGNLGITRGGYEDFIQTDAPINPGNSGGALLDSRGEVIGVNTAIFSGGARANAGIGFAVPIDMARNVMAQILEGGKVVRAQLGVKIKEVDATLAKSYGLQHPMGALVTDVVEDSPAEKAGLREEDLIVEMDGKGVIDDSQLRLGISSRKPGSKVELAVLREEDGKVTKKTFDATLGELRPEDARGGAGGGDGDERGVLRDEDNALRGIAVENLDEMSVAERRQLRIPDLTTGVVITEVEPGTPAQRAGLRPGDVITSVNQKPVSNASSFRAMARNVGKDLVKLKLMRGGDNDVVALEP